MLRAVIQLEVGDDGGTQMLKTRTGRHGSLPEETAVLLSGLGADESVHEVVLGSGEVNGLKALAVVLVYWALMLFGVFDFGAADGNPAVGALVTAALLLFDK